MNSVTDLAAGTLAGVRDSLFVRVPGVEYGGKNAMGRQFDALTFEGATCSL
jgi:hypothetical protein